MKKKLGALGAGSMLARDIAIQGGGDKKIYIGENARIQSHCIIGCWEHYGNQCFTPSIHIGDHCKIGEYNHITACNRIVIGNGCLTGRYVLISDNGHGTLSRQEADIPPIQRELVSKGEIIIGDNVWIGDKASILSGVHIGNNVIIGANAVVTRDIPSNSIAVGAPAIVIKTIEME